MLTRRPTSAAPVAAPPPAAAAAAGSAAAAGAGAGLAAGAGAGAGAGLAAGVAAAAAAAVAAAAWSPRRSPSDEACGCFCCCWSWRSSALAAVFVVWSSACFGVGQECESVDGHQDVQVRTARGTRAARAGTLAGSAHTNTAAHMQRQQHSSSNIHAPARTLGCLAAAAVPGVATAPPAAAAAAAPAAGVAGLGAAAKKLAMLRCLPPAEEGVLAFFIVSTPRYSLQVPPSGRCCCCRGAADLLLARAAIYPRNFKPPFSRSCGPEAARCSI